MNWWKEKRNKNENEGKKCNVIENEKVKKKIIGWKWDEEKKSVSYFPINNVFSPTNDLVYTNLRVILLF